MKGVIAVVGDSWDSPGLARLSGLMQNACSEHTVICGEDAQLPEGVVSQTIERADELDVVKAALVWANEDAVLVAASDLTNPSAPLAEYLDFVRAGFEAVIPYIDEDTPQPMFGIYTQSCLPAINSLLLSGRHSLLPLLGSVKTRMVDPQEVSKFGDPNDILSRSDSGPS